MTTGKETTLYLALACGQAPLGVGGGGGEQRLNLTGDENEGPIA